MTNIHINDEQMQQFVAKAVFDQLTPEKRSDLLQDAIKSLFATHTRKVGYRDETYVPMVEAYREAIVTVSRKVVREVIEQDDTFKAKIKEFITESFDRLYNNEELYDKICNHLSSNMADIISKSDY